MRSILLGFLGSIVFISLIFIVLQLRLVKSVNKKRVQFITKYKYPNYTKSTMSRNDIDKFIRDYNKHLVLYGLLIFIAVMCLITSLCLIVNLI